MRIPSFLQSIAISSVLLTSSAAYAQSVECTINVEFEGENVRISSKAANGQSAMARAIRTGCLTLCHTENAKDTCAQNCFKSSKLSATQCFDENDTLISPDREKARRTLLPPDPAERADQLPSRKNLLLSQWLGDTQKSKKKKRSPLLLQDGKRDNLLLTQPSQNPPLLMQ